MGQSSVRSSSVLIVGALARLIMPGKQSIGVIMTIVLGVLGSLIGSWVTYQVGLLQRQWRVGSSFRSSSAWSSRSS